MTQVRSNLHTDVAYDGGREAKAAGSKHRVVLKPGVNDCTDADMALLRQDPFFVKQEKAGYFIVLDDPAPVTAPVAAEKAPAAPTGTDGNEDPRAQRQGENKTQWKARLAALDADAAIATVVTDFLGLDAASQEAMYPTLSDAEKAAVDAEKAKTAPPQP